MMNAESITYELDGLTMEGFIAVGDSSAQTQPLVLIVHDWSGNRDFSQEKARYFAKQGFVAFAVDLFGKGKRGSDTDRSLNEKLLNELLSNRPIVVPRLHAALECAQSSAKIDPKKIMLIGFCMGGLCALDFARSGADIAGVVSVHGILNAMPNAPKNDIKAKILVLHGHEDKGVRPDDVVTFETEMTSRKADWQVHTFGNTFHAFTNPKANDKESGLVYNAAANARTWGLVRVFTDEIFA